MDEKTFWIKLEFRLCSEFAGLSERRDQYFWCDGFIPSLYNRDNDRPMISGHVWICNGQRQEEWRFTLILRKTIRTREEIDWDSLLPPENMPRWMSFDEECLYLEIEPAVAVPDLA